MATLYDIVGEYQQLYAMLTDPEADEQTVLDTLEGLQGELELKSEGYVKVLRQMEAEQKAFEAESDFFKQKADVRKNNIKRMKDALCQALILTGHDDKKGIVAGNYVLKVAGNGGQQPMVIDGEVPESFKRVILEDDKALIRKALEEGKQLDFAHLEERGKHLSIK